MRKPLVASVARPRQCSILERFFELAEREPDAIALRTKVNGSWHERSWRDYAADVRRGARALIHLEVRPGDRVVIVGPNRAEWLVAAVGAMAAGAAPVGIYVTSTADQAAYVAAHAQAKVAIVYDEQQLAKFRAQAAQL